MRRWAMVVVPVMLLVAAAAVSAQGTATVATRTDPTLGTFLTDAKGMTLYLFTKDTTPGQSSCYDQCAQSWPPFTASEPLTLPSGVPGELTTVARTDGTTQVAYNQIPLYYFAKDTQPGDTNGQGLFGVWFVVAPGAQFGAAPATPAASPAASPMAAAAVTIKDFKFDPPQLEVAVGETVTWTNQDGTTHTVTGDNGEFDSGNLDTGKSFSFTFTKAGTYSYHCSIHPFMKATVVVQ
jgi:amicyanin